MFNAAKDSIASRATQAWMNKLIARYGHVERVRIDSRRKTIEVSCQLEGESTPITVHALNYVIESEEGKKFIRVTQFQCTRPWLQTLLMDHGTCRRFEVPGWAAAAL